MSSHRSTFESNWDKNKTYKWESIHLLDGWWQVLMLLAYRRTIRLHICYICLAKTSRNFENKCVLITFNIYLLWFTFIWTKIWASLSLICFNLLLKYLCYSRQCRLNLHNKHCYILENKIISKNLTHKKNFALSHSFLQKSAWETEE